MVDLGFYGLRVQDRYSNIPPLLEIVKEATPHITLTTWNATTTPQVQSSRRCAIKSRHKLVARMKQVP